MKQDVSEERGSIISTSMGKEQNEPGTPDLFRENVHLLDDIEVNLESSTSSGELDTKSYPWASKDITSRISTPREELPYDQMPTCCEGAFGFWMNCSFCFSLTIILPIVFLCLSDNDVPSVLRKIIPAVCFSAAFLVVLWILRILVKNIIFPPNDIPALRPLLNDSELGTPPRKILIICNPNAGFKTAKARVELVKNDLINDFGVNVVVELTEDIGHATALVRDMPNFDYDVVVAAGGDGTLNEIVNGLIARFDSPSLMPPVAVIPCGSGNALFTTLRENLQMKGRDMHCYDDSTALRWIAETVASGSITRIDSIEVATQNRKIIGPEKTEKIKDGS